MSSSWLTVTGWLKRLPMVRVHDVFHEHDVVLPEDDRPPKRVPGPGHMEVSGQNVAALADQVGCMFKLQLTGN